MRHATALAAAIAVALLASCGTQVEVGRAEPRGKPYDGPMKVKQDLSDNATPLERAGAAGRALECDGSPYFGGAGDYDGGLEFVQDTPKMAVRNLRDQAFTVPRSGYQVERDDGDRVLLSYDVDGRTKAAFIAAKGIQDTKGHRGWGIESWATCDPAEFPAKVTEAHGIGVWVDSSGDRVPVSWVRSDRGPKHCAWQGITFLRVGPKDAAGRPVGRNKNAEQYLRDTNNKLGDYLQTTYDGSATLPDDATDTGYHRNGRELWIGPKREAAYLVSRDDPHDVERWPATTRYIYCM